jgi:hypothetical protein
MTPPPVAVGLIVCEQVIVDQHTRNPSPISIFTGLAVESFPSPPQRCSVFASLTNGRGDATLRLVVTRLDTGETIYEQRFPIRFPDPLLVVNVNIRVRGVRFPVPGHYEFALHVDSDPVAHRTLRVRSL